MNPHESSQIPGLHSTHPSISSSMAHGIPHFPAPRMHPLLLPETTQSHSLHSTHGSLSSGLGHCIPQLPVSRMNPPQPQETSHMFSLHSTHHPQVTTVSSSLSHNIQQLPTQSLNQQETVHTPNLHSTLSLASSGLSHSVTQLQVPTPRMTLQMPEVIQAPNLHHLQTSVPILGGNLTQSMECNETITRPPTSPISTGDAPTKIENKPKKKKGKKKGAAEEKLTQKGKLRKMPTKITPEVLVIINRIISYFEREKASQQPLYAWRCVNSRVAQATGLSPRTVQRIREAEKNRPPGQPIVKKIKKKSTGRPSTLKESDRFHISNTLDAMQRSKEPVTLAKLKTKLDTNGLVISRSTLARIIQKMGFHYSPAKSEKGKPHEDREKNEERGAWSRDQSAKEQWEKEMHQRIKLQAERETSLLQATPLLQATQHTGNGQQHAHQQQQQPPQQQQQQPPPQQQQPQQHQHQQQHQQQQSQQHIRNNQQNAMHTQHARGTGRLELDDDQHGYLREFGHEEDSVDGASDRSDEMQLGNFLREFGHEAVTTAYGATGSHS